MLAIQRFTAVSAVDAAFRVYRENFKPLFLLSLIAGVPATLIGVAIQVLAFRMSSDAVDPELGLGGFSTATIVALMSVGVMTMLVAIIAAMLAMAGTTRIASLAALSKKPDLKDGLAAAFEAFWPLIGATIIATLAAAFASIFFIVPGIIVMLGFAFVAPVVVLERVNAADALSRSWKLTRGRRARIFGAYLLVAILVITTSGGVGFVAGVTGLFNDSLAGQVTQTLLEQAGSILATPLGYVTIVLLYYGARVEQEAFDVEMLTRSALPETRPSA